MQCMWQSSKKLEQKREGLQQKKQSYAHPVKDRITIMKKTDTYMQTLLPKLLQSQCIISLKENYSLHKEKVDERNPSYKFMTDWIK